MIDLAYVKLLWPNDSKGHAVLSEVFNGSSWASIQYLGSTVIQFTTDMCINWLNWWLLSYLEVLAVRYII